ncbi:MAG: UDP-2,3-diacylglucosamine diphosphatase [Rikenellaceae bacterium]
MYYFIADTHLGSVGGDGTEDRLIKWIESIEPTAKALFLCGDIFDFWFEYDRVVPMGFTSVLAKFKQLSRAGIRVVMMVGNHDLWMDGYLTRECGVEIYYRPTHFDVAGRRVHVAHGDNLNVRGDMKLKLMNFVFRSQTARSLFKTFVHPDLAIRFGSWWSGKSRKKHCGENDYGRGVGMLLEYAAQRQAQIESDYYLYGHLHVAKDHQAEGYRVLFMNDWSSDPHYVVIDEDGDAELKRVNQ